MDSNNHRDSCIFYRSFYESIKKIDNNDDKVAMYEAIFELALNGVETHFEDGIASIIFPLIEPQIQANYKRYLNGCKPKTEQNSSKSKTNTKQKLSNQKANNKQSKSKTGTNENVNENVNENIYVYFEKFWELYPRKVNKKNAKEKFFKICVNDEIFKKMMHGLRKCIDSSDWKKDDGQYIPHPTTWLNGERWNDEIVVDSNSNKESNDLITNEIFGDET